MHVQDPVKRMQAVQTVRKRKLWYCSFQQWLPRWRGCYCLSNWYTPGVGNLRHACQTWHGKQFPMASRNSKFYISILLWFTRSIIDLDFHKNADVVDTLNDLEPKFRKVADIDSEKEWWQHTPLSVSNNHGECGCGLSPLTRRQIRQEYDNQGPSLLLAYSCKTL